MVGGGHPSGRPVPRPQHLLAPMPTASSTLRCPSPHPQWRRWQKSLPLSRVSPYSLAFISNHFPAWHHKKNVSNVQTTVFLALGGPDIITATTSPGLHPNPLLPLAQGLKAEGCRALVLPAWALGARAGPHPGHGTAWPGEWLLWCFLVPMVP